MPKEIFVEKNVIINQSNDVVFNFLKFVRNQDKFSVWNMADPNQKITEKGVDGTVGYSYSWDSENKRVGAGTQEIKHILEQEKIEYELRFVRPMKNIGYSTFTFHKISDSQCKVVWTFKGPTKFPMSLFKGVFQRMLGKDLQKSLGNLKVILEK